MNRYWIVVWSFLQCDGFNLVTHELCVGFTWTVIELAGWLGWLSFGMVSGTWTWPDIPCVAGCTWACEMLIGTAAPRLGWMSFGITGCIWVWLDVPWYDWLHLDLAKCSLRGWLHLSLAGWSLVWLSALGLGRMFLDMHVYCAVGSTCAWLAARLDVPCVVSCTSAWLAARLDVPWYGLRQLGMWLLHQCMTGYCWAIDWEHIEILQDYTYRWGDQFTIKFIQRQREGRQSGKEWWRPLLKKTKSGSAVNKTKSRAAVKKTKSGAAVKKTKSIAAVKNKELCRWQKKRVDRCHWKRGRGCCQGKKCEDC